MDIWRSGPRAIYRRGICITFEPCRSFGICSTLEPHGLGPSIISVGQATAIIHVGAALGPWSLVGPCVSREHASPTWFQARVAVGRGRNTNTVYHTILCDSYYFLP